MRHIHVSALHPNQTTLKKGIEAELAAYVNEYVIPQYWIVNSMEGS